MSAREENVAGRGSVGAGLTLYREPTNRVTELDVQPRLESWERSDHPDQIALRRYVDHVHDLVIPALRAHENGELALRLVVGLTTDTPLVGAGGDLDNYLFPLMRGFGADRFASAWGLKHHGPSTIAIDSARTATTDGLQDWDHATVQTTESAEGRAWKEQIHAQLPSQPEDDRPLEFQLCFRVGPRRNWTTLWKPSIDALGPLLGNNPAGRRFNPRDDRIVRLGLHRNLDPAAGHEVTIGVWWRLASTSSNSPAH